LFTFLNYLPKNITKQNKQKPYIRSKTILEFCLPLMVLVLYPGRPCNHMCLWLFPFMVLNATFNNISIISWRSV